MKDFQQEDQALFETIEAYRSGDGDKAAVIYESTKKYTYKILYKEVERYKNQGALTSDVVSITEDIMQELYIEFFNKIANFRNEDPKSIFKWISVVSHRMLLDYVDKNKMEVLQFEKDEDYREDNDIWDSSEINDSDMESNHELLPEAALEDKEFRQLIMDFVQSLPDAQAQTILLHFRGGLKYQEIADEMGVSLITVKTRMKKAKDLLEEIITKYEKKTGTKLHSVSILPLLWLLYRMSSEETVVPVAVDTAVAGSLAGASGVGIGGATTVGSVATKAISTRVLVAIVSTAVAIGGVAMGSQLIDKKPETTIEQGDSEDKELDNKQDNEGSDDTSSEGDNDTGNDKSTGSDTNNQTQGKNNGSDTVTNTNGTGESPNGAESNTGAGSNTNGTDSNTGTGNSSENENTSSGNEGTDGSEDSGNEDTSESTAAKGTKENPYRIGEKITISNVAGNSTSDLSSYTIEITVTEYTVPKLDNLTYIQSANMNKILNVVKAKVKIIGESTEPYVYSPINLGVYAEDGKGYGHSGNLYQQDGNLMTAIYNNVAYDIGFHMTESGFNEELTYSYFKIGYRNLDNSLMNVYVKLE
ncbi:MAG: sigma-70 family RNA polymerase sigma factor [Clostridia bacterium]|nr:sigma-70 family RNA polymerase sigma factor [Clostridia bacterium]